MQQIRIQYLDATIKRLEYIDGKSDWIDLRAAEDVNLKQGEFRLIHLGVAMQLPKAMKHTLYLAAQASKTTESYRQITWE